MARLVQLRSTCNHGNVCPTLYYQPDSDEFLVQGFVVTDPHALARLNLSVVEAVVRIPTYLLPELQPDPAASELLVQGRVVHDIDLLRELDLPSGETAVRIRAQLLPDLRKEHLPC